jgi:hypothetical protein
VKMLRFRVQLVAEDEQATNEQIIELAVLEKDCER